MNALAPVEAAHHAERKGFDDATRGITTCPFALADNVKLWNRGYDYAFDNGQCRLPRFSALRNRRR